MDVEVGMEGVVGSREAAARVLVGAVSHNRLTSACMSKSSSTRLLAAMLELILNGNLLDRGRPRTNAESVFIRELYLMSKYPLIWDENNPVQTREYHPILC